MKESAGPEAGAREVALAYLRAFAAADLAALERLLDPDLRFRGPLHVFDSSAAYLGSLAGLAPERIDILSAVADHAVASVFYEYVKVEGNVTVAQLFRTRGGLVVETLVVFDARPFAAPAADAT